MRVIYSTVGRRSEDNHLRPLNPEELSQFSDKTIVNVPLEAGFDMEPADTGVSPVDLCNQLGREEWEAATFGFCGFGVCPYPGTKNLFVKECRSGLKALSAILPSSGDMIIAHTMAGGGSPLPYFHVDTEPGVKRSG